MTAAQYFIIQGDEDGTVIDGPLSEAEVLDRITPDEDGDTYYGSDLVCLDKIPDSNPNWWPTGQDAVIIIRGEIIVPKALTTVTSFQLGDK